MLNKIKRFYEENEINLKINECYENGLGNFIYEVSLPAKTKASSVLSTEQDLSLWLGRDVIINVKDSILQIEVLGTQKLINWKDYNIYNEFDVLDTKIKFCLGVNESGETVFVDICDCPHILIGGQTGSGKSILLHTIIQSLMNCRDRLYLIDPKQVELSMYQNTKNCMEYGSTIDEAIEISRTLIFKMNLKYNYLKNNGYRHVDEIIKSSNGEKGYKTFFIVDEFADLTSQGRKGKEFQTNICQLAQKGRAAGIHVIIATQRPSVKVINGDIKANFPSRIGLKTVSAVDSRTILDTSGAEKLRGKGELIFNNGIKLEKIQSCFIDNETIKYNCELNLSKDDE